MDPRLMRILVVKAGILMVGMLDVCKRFMLRKRKGKERKGKEKRV